MKWDYEKHTLSIVSSYDYEGDEAVYLTFGLEINYVPYEAIYVLPHDEGEEKYLEVVTHGDEHFWCRFCQQQSTKSPVCTALTNDEHFDIELVEAIDNHMDILMWNDTQGYGYDGLDKNEFQELVYPFALMYDKQHDCFHAGFALGDEEEIHSPHLFLGIEYEKTPEGFVFDLANAMITHYEGDILSDDVPLTDIMCDCGYEYDHKRYVRDRQPVGCNLFIERPHFTTWAWEVIMETEGFIARIRSCLEEEVTNEPLTVKNENIVSFEDYKKRKK